MSRMSDLIISVVEDFERGLSIRQIAKKNKIPIDMVCQILRDKFKDLVGGP